MKPGWNWLSNSRVWHYFDSDGRSLCGRYMVFSNEDAKSEDIESPDNCKKCYEKRSKAKETIR